MTSRMGVLDGDPASLVVLVRQRRLAPIRIRTAKTAARHDRVERRFVELVHEVEVVERLDVGRPEPGLFVRARAAHPRRCARFRLDRPGHALPEPRQDPPGARRSSRISMLAHVPRGMDDTEHPAVDEIGAERAHRASLIGVRSPSWSRRAGRADASSRRSRLTGPRARMIQASRQPSALLGSSRPTAEDRDAREGEPDRRLDRQRRAGRPGRRQLRDRRRELRGIGDDRDPPDRARRGP